jgi:1-acyl-sn-glycerol-3-phosphate acyltransferase
MRDYYEISNDNISLRQENFRILTFEEKNKLTPEEKIEYYKNLKEYYLNLPYESKKVKKAERNYRITSIFIGKILDLKLKHKLVNRNEMPKFKGPVIYVSNHLSNIDPPIIMRTIGIKPVHLLLKYEFWGEKFEKPLSKIGIVFVDRENRDSRLISKEELTKLVLRGKNILIFPEGKRNTGDKPLLELEYGALSIAQITGVPIVAFALSRTNGDKTTYVRYAGTMSIDMYEDLSNAKNRLSEMLTKALIENNNYLLEKESTVKPYIKK